jgi:8-oxo-dGTP pyrophosphatase MutT (NUDIX family)
VREIEEELGFRLDPEELRFVKAIDGTSEWRNSHIELFETDVANTVPIRVDGREIVGAFAADVQKLPLLPLDPVLREYLTSRNHSGTLSQYRTEAPLELATERV